MVETYRMARSLCDTAARSNRFTFELDDREYRDLCNGTVGFLYAKLGEHGKDRKRLPQVADNYSDIIRKAENELKKHI